MRDYYVYMLRCSDGSYYIGVTNDVTARVSQHQLGLHPKSYTHTRRPVEYVYSTEFGDIHEAIAWEKRIKRWSRAKKEALIRGDFEGLIPLSKRKSVQEKMKQKIADLMVRGS